MLTKDTVKNWLNKNNWLMLQEKEYGDKTSNIYALAPSGLEVQFNFDAKGNFGHLNVASISTNV